MRTILDVIKAGEQLKDKELIRLAKMLDEFKQTEIYQIIKALNEEAIKELLTVGKTSEETAEHRLGKMEGIQDGFENRILSIVRNGELALKLEKQDKVVEKEIEEEKVYGEEDIGVSGDQSV